MLAVSLKGLSRGMLHSRIRRQDLHAVNVEQENEIQQQISTTTSTQSGINSSNNDFNTSNNIYELLGLQEGQLALGVKPEEVYQYIGTYVVDTYRYCREESSTHVFLFLFKKSREELVSKTLADIPALSREMAETEVDKFLMDCEMVNMYIQYGKEVEKDPNFVVPNNDNDTDSNSWFTPRNIVAGYLTYVGVTSGPQVARRYIAEQEVKGEWEPTNIQFIDQWIDRTSAEATARVLEKAAEKAAKIAAAAVDTTTSTTTTVDAIASSLSSALPTDSMAPDILTDSLQSLVDTAATVTP
jgi:hypothetical protein